MRKFYKQMEERAIAGLEKSIDGFQTKGIDDEAVFNFGIEYEEARKDSRRFFQASVTRTVNVLNTFFRTNVDPSSKNPELQLIVENLSIRYADLTINSRRDELRQIISQSINEGVGIGEVKARIEAHFDTLTRGNAAGGWRATRIARSEASYAWDQASVLSYKDIGVTTIDIVGCLEAHAPWDCNKRGFPLENIDKLKLHPNHTGTSVPSDMGLIEAPSSSLPVPSLPV